MLERIWIIFLLSLVVKELSILSRLDTYAELQEDLANTYSEFKEDQTNLIVDKIDTTTDTLRRLNNTGEQPPLIVK